MQDIPHSWLTLVERVLLELDVLPSMEAHFPFPWEEAAQKLQGALGITELSLSCASVRKRSPQEFLHGMGSDPSVISIGLSPIKGCCHIAVSQQDMKELTSEALAIGTEKESFSGLKLRQGFYHFLALKALQALGHLNVFEKAKLQLLPPTSLPQEECLSVDLICKLSLGTIQFRVICPEHFLNSFKDHLPFQKASLFSFASEEPLEITLRPQVGRTQISEEELANIQVGDFVMLDSCSFDPKEDKGSLTLYSKEIPLAVTRIKPEGLKVLDYAFTHEEIPSEGITLTANTNSIVISLSKLLEIEPNSMIPISIHPEQGITLMHRDKSIAKGELIRLGEAVGIRVLEIEPPSYG